MIRELEVSFEKLLTLDTPPSSSLREIAKEAHLDPSSDFVGLNLEGLDFSGQDLSGFNFSYSNLSKAKLAKARLVNTDLSFADLSGADLTGCVLQQTNLSYSDISGAVIQDVDISETILTGISGAPRTLVAGARTNNTDASTETEERRVFESVFDSRAHIGAKREGTAKVWMHRILSRALSSDVNTLVVTGDTPEIALREEYPTPRLELVVVPLSGSKLGGPSSQVGYSAMKVIAIRCYDSNPSPLRGGLVSCDKFGFVAYKTGQSKMRRPAAAIPGSTARLARSSIKSGDEVVIRKSDAREVAQKYRGKKPVLLDGKSMYRVLLKDILQVRPRPNTKDKNGSSKGITPRIMEILDQLDFG